MAKTSADIRSLARAYTAQGVKVLGGYITSKDTDPEIKIRAIGMLFDRGWGKAAQPLTGANGSEDIQVTIRTIIAKDKK